MIPLSIRATDFAEGDGTISSKLIDYHEARAKGGVGLWDNNLIPCHRKLTEWVRT